MSLARKLFNNPIRQETTAEFFPCKLTIEEFKDVIVDNFNAYAGNATMGKFDNPKYIEEWVEQYLAWSEIEEE